MKTIRFFAAEDDLLNVCKQLEETYALTYVPSGCFESPDVPRYTTVSAIPGFTEPTEESSINNQAYLIIDASATLNLRRIDGDDGQPVFCVDLLENPEAIALLPGGRYAADVVLYGTAGFASEATPLSGAFTSILKKNFKKVKAFWVGQRALADLRAGIRLAQAASSPRSFDLVE